MSGTPPARPEGSTTPGPPLAVPRLALEALPQPFLIFEPSLRLNFINAAARRFFGLDAHLHAPESLVFAASDLFGEDVSFQDDQEPSPGDRFEVGEWNERIRMLECRRRQAISKPDSPPISVRAAVNSFLPNQDYFASAQGSRLTAGSWFTVMLLATPSSPASSSASTATPGGHYAAAERRAPRIQSAYSQFAASARARTPVVLRGALQRNAVLSPSGRSVRSVDGSLSGLPASPGSFFPNTPAASTTSVSSGSTTGSSASMVGTSSYAPSTNDSTSSSVGELDQPGPSKLMTPVLSMASERAGPTQVPMPSPPPSQTSPAAIIAEQSRLLDLQREKEREQRERAEEEERRLALSPKPASAPQSEPMRIERSASPPATPLPPGTPSASATSTAPNPLAALTHAALSNLPRTGLVLASKDLNGGYVNDTARELLLGVKLPATSDTDEEDWMEDGLWIAQPAPGGRWTWDGAEFFRGLDANAPVTQGEADISASKAEIDSASSLTGIGEVAIGLPTQLYKMTVATILQRSVKLSKARRRALRQRAQAPLATQSGAVTALRDLPSTSAPLTMNTPFPATFGIPNEDAKRSAPENVAPLAQTESKPKESKEPPAASKPTKKPYKVYDATFAQRIIDPLEPLLEMCARRGQSPDASLGGSSGLTVGLEVEVAEDSVLAADTFETTIASTSKRKVRRRLVEVKGAVIHQPNGAHLGGMLVLRDVTDEKSPSAQLIRPSVSSGRLEETRQDDHFKVILDQMPQMVWTTTPSGATDYFNNQWYEFTGLEPEQSLGLGWQNPFHDDDMPHTIKAWSHSLATGDPYSVEYRCRRYDGSWRWMLGRALPMRDFDGKITGWFGTCTDIEDAVNIRAQLLRTREQFIGVLNGADVTIVSLDNRGRISLVEGPDVGMLRERFGGDIIGHPFKDVWDAGEDVIEMMDKVESGQIPTGRLESRGPNDHPYRLSIRLGSENLADGTTRRTGLIIVYSDISDLRDAELALKESAVERSRLMTSEAAAKEASRLKSAWLANTTHEVRTPISAMIGLAELLMDDPTLSSEHRQNVERIVRSCEILLEMIGMVLDMGKVEAGKLEIDEHTFWLQQVLSDVRIFSHAASRKGLEFREDMKVKFKGPLVGDMPRLRQILGNILSNAIKFTSEGSVTLRSTGSNETNTAITITFTIIDTGIGIKPEAQPSLFQPFHQADASTARKFGGTGLGLSITKSLVELMGGNISMSSVYRQGTTMEVSIRFMKAQEKPSSPPPEEEPQEGQGKTIDRSATWILLAEDNELNRDIVVKLLQRLGFNVESVTNGQEVLEASQRRNWDLVLMDGQMPGLDGYETTQLMRQSTNPAVRDVKIVALTASALQGERERCIDAGMDDYIAKPVRLRDLESVIIKNLCQTIKTPPALANAPTPGLASIQSHSPR